jgi:urease accessory protein
MTLLRLTGVVGSASDAALAERLHELEHAGRVEYLSLSGADIGRHRLHAETDRGTECAIILPRHEHLANGAVLLLERDRAIVVRLAEAQWLDLEPRDAAAAVELGYFAGNMHWPVRFDGARLRIQLHGPEADYLARLDHLIADGRVRQVRDAE